MKATELIKVLENIIEEVGDKEIFYQKRINIDGKYLNIVEDVNFYRFFIIKDPKKIGISYTSRDLYNIPEGEEAIIMTTPDMDCLNDYDLLPSEISANGLKDLSKPQEHIKPKRIKVGRYENGKVKVFNPMQSVIEKELLKIQIPSDLLETVFPDTVENIYHNKEDDIIGWTSPAKKVDDYFDTEETLFIKSKDRIWAFNTEGSWYKANLNDKKYSKAEPITEFDIILGYFKRMTLYEQNQKKWFKIIFQILAKIINRNFN